MTYQYEQPLLVSRLGHMSMSPPELATAMSSVSKLSAPAPTSPPQQPTNGLASDVQIMTTQVPEKKRRASRHRSTGCGTCRKRKIKCDEQKPACLNCQKTGRECLGYRTPEELARPHFAKQPRANQSERQYGLQAESDYMGNSSNLSDMDLLHEFGQSYHEPAHSMCQETPMGAAPFLLDTCSDEQEMPPIDLIWNAQALPTSLTRLETFFFRRFISSIWLHSYSDMWSKMLPGLMNTSAPLYHSILAVSAMYMYKIGIDNRARDSALSHYSLAVNHLQQALYTPDKAFQDTTLMATVIMGFYEMLDKDDHKSWCAHTKGAQQLIRMRGLRATGHGIGKMLFLTLRGYETVRAILEYEETIFADEKWTVMSMNPATRMQAAELLEGPCPPVTAKQLMSSPPVDHACVLYMLGNKVGSCQAKAHKLFKQKRLDMSHKMAIDADLSSIIERLHRWRELLPSTYNGKDAPSSLPMSPFRTILIYGSSIQAQQICFYSAFLLQAYRVKAKYVLGDATCLPPDAQDLARTIIRVADSFSAGLTTSSLQITWPLYAASIAIENPDEQRWARRMLKAIVADKGWAIATQALKAHSVVSLRDRAAGRSPATSASSRGSTFGLSHLPPKGDAHQ